MKFFDFCSGIGTARIALESLGHRCVGHAEIDAKAIQTYQLFFGDEEKNWGDLMQIDPAELPDFDLMVAGFPCQSFSIVGKRQGLEDERGQIIHGLCRILKRKHPKQFLLENVKGLLNHEKGHTLKEVLRLLDEAGYRVSYKVLKSTDYGIPQIRERIFLMGSLDGKEFTFPEHAPKLQRLDSLLIDEDPKLEIDFDSRVGQTFKEYLKNKYNFGKFNFNQLLAEEYLVLDTRQSDLRLFRDVIPTLRTGRHGILYVKNGKLRKLSGLESLLLQGIPKSIAEKASKVSNTALLSQAGNAMTVDVIKALGEQL